MKTIITYSDYLTSDNQQTLSKISADLSSQIEIDLEVKLDSEGNKNCEVKFIDKIGVNELAETIGKDEIRELIQMLRTVYNAL